MAQHLLRPRARLSDRQGSFTLRYATDPCVRPMHTRHLHELEAMLGDHPNGLFFEGKLESSDSSTSDIRLENPFGAAKVSVAQP
jgi:hypothetical protein